MFDFFTVFYLFYKHLRRLECRNVMLVYYDRGIFGNVTRNLLCSSLIDETSKSSDIDVISICHRIFYYFEKRLNCLSYIVFLDSGLLGNFSNYFCFSHCDKNLEIRNTLNNLLTKYFWDCKCTRTNAIKKDIQKKYLGL